MSEQKWIPVSERLPEKGVGELYLVQVDDSILCPYHIAIYGSTGKWIDNEGKNITEFVIAWQPLSPYVPPVEEKPKECPHCGIELNPINQGSVAYVHPFGDDCLHSLLPFRLDQIPLWNRRAPIVWTPELQDKLRKWSVEWDKECPNANISYIVGSFLSWIERTNSEPYSLDE